MDTGKRDKLGGGRGNSGRDVLYVRKLYFQ